MVTLRKNIEGNFSSLVKYFLSSLVKYFLSSQIFGEDKNSEKQSDEIT